MVKHGEKNLRKQHTLVDIPDELKFMKANSMMLEQFVMIMEEKKEEKDKKKDKKHIKYDNIMEFADECKEFYTKDIYFPRGIAMMNYI